MVERAFQHPAIQDAGCAGGAVLGRGSVEPGGAKGLLPTATSFSPLLLNGLWLSR